jgi:chitosanase
MSNLITPEIKKKIQTIVSVFETSSTQPLYDILVCLNDGPGGIKQITYGKHQTTEYGNLHALIKMYIDRNGRYTNDFKSYLAFIGSHDHPLADNLQFKQLLKLAGTDYIMHQVQDEFFDQYYWHPAVNFFEANRFSLPLSMAVIYDSYIHSGGIPMWLRSKFNEKTPLGGGNEKEWISEYVYTRDNWLEHHENKVLRNTDYRTDCWIDQIHMNNWDLMQPVICKFNSDNKNNWLKIP